MIRYATPLVALLLAAPLGAQAPHITPQGDPSVRNDTIYALAVDAAAHPEEAAVYLLDDGVLRYEADGTGRRTFRQVVQILKPEAVDDWQEFSFSYVPDRQRLTVNWIRVVRPDGTVVSAEPTMVQESDVPAAMRSPVYTETKVVRASLSGVAVGTIVDASYTLEDVKAYHPGDFQQWWAVTTGLQVRRSRLILDVPASLEPRLLERNLGFRRQTRVRDGRRVLTWAAHDVPRVKGEAFAADTNTVTMSVELAAPKRWADVAAWYAGLSNDRYALEPAAAAKVAGVVAGARTREDTLRAVHRWVAQDIRYVSVALGLGGYQPRHPAEVLQTELGDCKDKSTLFIAALRHLGLEAYPVLVHSYARATAELPSIHQFDHLIAAVREPGGGYRYVDLTADLVPYGRIPPGLQGGFGLLVRPDGSAEEVRLPFEPGESNLSLTRIAGAIDAEGRFNGVYEEEARGTYEYPLREAFLTPLDSTRTAEMARGLATNFFDGARGDSLTVFDGKDFAAEARLRMRILDGRAVTHSGGTAIFTLPFRGMGSMANAAAALEAQEARRFPIDAAQVVGPAVGVTELRVALPEGWVARLPRSVRAQSEFGSYTAEYAQTGNELRIVRRMEGRRGVLPPERIGELIAWYRAVGEDDVRFIVMDTAGGAD